MSTENPFIRGYLRGQQLKRQQQQDANAAEDRKFEIEKRTLELKAMKLAHDRQEKERARAEAMQTAELLQGQPGSVPGINLSPTPGGPQEDPNAVQAQQGPPGSQIQALLMQARAKPIPLQSAGIPGVQTPPTQPKVTIPGVAGPDVQVQPQSAEELIQQQRQKAIEAAQLKRMENTYTVTDPSTGQEVTAPKEILDNLLTQTGQAKRQKEQQNFTAGENEADRASREAIAEANRNAATARALASGKSSKTITQANNFSKEFSSNDIVKNYAVIQEAAKFAGSMGPTSANDIGLLYAFAKVMDPGSVVREGEYATVQKYAQSWAQQFGFKVERIFTNSPFLSAEARKNMVQTIKQKESAAKASYDNYHAETTKKFRNIGEKPEDWLIDYNLDKTSGKGDPLGIR